MTKVTKGGSKEQRNGFLNNRKTQNYFQYFTFVVKLCSVLRVSHFYVYFARNIFLDPFFFLLKSKSYFVID